MLRPARALLRARPPNLSITRLRPHHLDAAVEVLVESCTHPTKGEPLTLATGMSKEAGRHYHRFVTEELLPMELSFGMLDNGRLVGVLTARDIAVPDIDIEPICAQYPAVHTMEEACSLHERRVWELRGVDNNEDVGLGKVCAIYYVAVLPDYMGCKIGTLLTSEALRNAGDRGYELSFAESTSCYSKAALQQCGMAETFNIPYEELVHTHPAFAQVPKKHKGVALMTYNHQRGAAGA
eukprot:TRINITY_DN15400_c0_g1_i1.p1 TRINITY_DN15400_c0_g1~~TRINITY_DN15400_c0_g1_i1.p1  ORF type:complete len:262 (+),score=74.07 TRINITY_DN15400_c0_g1_i1:73-786(+)